MTTEDAEPRRFQKPWGEELIWAHAERYVGKVLVIEAGGRLSLPRHEIKDEAIYVVSGRLRLWLENDAGEVRAEELGPGESRRVRTGRVHRFEAIERCELSQGATPGLEECRPPR